MERDGSGVSVSELHPLDAGLMEIKAPLSGLTFPPADWRILQEWGFGYALQHRNGLRAIIDCSQKEDDRWWVHVSVSRSARMPTHDDMTLVKQAFLGDRYAYAVYPPKSEYVNIHIFCLHLWTLVDGENGRVLPEFAGEVAGIKSI
jgi:hypothetical protein